MDDILIISHVENECPPPTISRLQSGTFYVDRLILKKIIKIVATRCQILRLKCTKFDFSWGSAPDPAGRAYSAPPDHLAGFDGSTSKGRVGKGRS